MNKLTMRSVDLLSLSELKKYEKLAAKVLAEKQVVLSGELTGAVKSLLAKRHKILDLARQHQTPFYILDQEELERSVNEYLAAFEERLPDGQHYYAIKLNPHPFILKKVLAKGFGLDVSSGRELGLALRVGAKKILFSGPGKTNSELELAVKNSQKTIINIDSFGELERLDAVAAKMKTRVNSGIRIYTKHHGEWSKFGIPLKDLKKFWRKAEKCRYVNLQGIQFHMSSNKDEKPYRSVLKDVALYLKQNFSPKMLKDVKFIDFGGGFLPYQTEGYFPNRLAKGAIIKEISDSYSFHSNFKEPYYITESVPMSQYAQGITSAIDEFFRPLLQCAYFSEPGRIICNQAMHVLLSVVDLKSPNVAILDGGINIVGWERFEWDYFPVINLSRPALKEKKIKLFGSLCLPADTWGNYCYAKDVKPGDLILVPYQGALTYVLAQNFIKPIPPVHILKD